MYSVRTILLITLLSLQLSGCVIRSDPRLIENLKAPVSIVPGIYVTDSGAKYTITSKGNNHYLYEGPASTGAKIKREYAETFQQKEKNNDWESEGEREIFSKFVEATKKLADDTVFQDRYTFTTAKLSDKWFVVQLRLILNKSYAPLGSFMSYSPESNQLWMVNVEGSRAKLYRTENCNKEELLKASNLKIEKNEIVLPASAGQVKKLLTDCSRLYKKIEPSLILTAQSSQNVISDGVRRNYRINNIDQRYIVNNNGISKIIQKEVVGDNIHYEAYAVEAVSDDVRKWDLVIEGIFNIKTQRFKSRSRGYPAISGCGIIWTPSTLSEALWSNRYVPVMGKSDTSEVLVWRSSDEGGDAGSYCAFPIISKSQCKIVSCSKWEEAKPKPNEVYLLVTGLENAQALYSRIEKISREDERLELDRRLKRGTLDTEGQQKRFMKEWQQSIDDFVIDQL